MSHADTDGIDAGELERRFAELVEREPEAREQALRELLDADPALARRLAALLDAHSGGTSALENLGEAARSAIGVVEPADLIGRELGGYRLVEVLGQGGMGVVFGARRESEGVRQRAAVKLLSVPMFDSAAAARFSREAQLLARLDHPGICKLRDFGRSPEGWPYLVLDRIDGLPLHRHAQDRSVAERIALVARVADAVAAAHRQLVVHLDIKPENVLVTAEGDPVLLDFGIARALGEDGETTATLARWMTPDYAAPERLRGEPSTVAADLYSLGAMLYRVCCGTKPFELGGQSITDALRTIEQGAIAPTRRVSGLPRDLDAIVAKAMRADPARRYASADAFAEDLRALLAAQPVKARPDTWGYRLRKLFQRHPVALPSGVFAVLALVSLLALLMAQARDLRAQRDRAEREAARAASATSYLLDSLDAIDPKTRTESGIGLAQLLDVAQMRLRSQREQDPRLAVDVEAQFGRVRASLGQNEAALAAYDRALETAKTLGASIDAARVSVIEANRADALRVLGRLDESLLGAERAVTLAGQDRAARLLAVQRKAMALSTMGRFEEAEAVAEASLALVDEADRVESANLFNTLAMSALGRMEYGLAERHARRAYELYLQAYDEPHFNTTEAAWRLAAGLLNTGRSAEAEPLLEEARDMRIALYGENDSRVGQVLLVLSDAQQRLGKLDQSLANARRGLAIYEATLDPSNMSFIMAFSRVGNRLHEMGHSDEAIEYFRRGLELARSIHGDKSHPTLAFFLQALAGVEESRGNYEASTDLARQTIAMMDGFGAAEGVNAMLIRLRLAMGLRHLGTLDEALREIERAWSIGQRALPADDWQLASVRSELGHILLLSGRSAEAESHLLEAEVVLGPDDSPAVPVNRLTHARAMRAFYERTGDPDGLAAMQARVVHLEE